MRRLVASPLLRLLLAYVLICTGLVPAGYMPGRSESGNIALILCSGKTIPQQQDHTLPADHAAPCPFALAATGALDAPAAPTLAAPAVYTLAPRSAQREPQLYAALPTRTQNPRAPPFVKI